VHLDPPNILGEVAFHGGNDGSPPRSKELLHTFAMVRFFTARGALCEGDHQQGSQLQKSFESDYSKAGPAVKAAVIEFQVLFGYRQSQQGEDALLESMKTDLDDAIKACNAEPSMLKCASS
jgi:hypothetical protein